MLLAKTMLVTFLAKTVIGMLIVPIAVSATVGYVNFKAPYAKNLDLHVGSIEGNTVTIIGSVDIHYKNPQAWRDFGYKDGNFQYFYQYWQDQEGKTFTYAGISAKLLDITIVLAEHTPSKDHLEFTIVLERV
jgi:hypothetical protein